MNALLCSSDRGTSPSGFVAERKSFGGKLKVQSKITASEPLPLDSLSESVAIEELLEAVPVAGGKQRERHLHRIGLSRGFVVPECTPGFPAPRGWIRQLKLAANVHFQNVSVEVAKGRRIRVRVVADVKVGEEMQLWFSPQVLIAMQIPFLTPANIKGQNVYFCHECSRVFEDPNPLKLHLARNCDTLPLDTLWQRLRNSLPQETSPTPSTTAHPPPAHQNNHLSAFHPVHHHHHQPATTTAFNYSDPDHLAASHLETIVSNMGTSKQGHLCIYCGKLYSRKYGLKIHIRTHTGFKPLKCKFCHRPFGDPSNLNKHIRLHLQNQSPTSHNSNGAAHPSFYKCHLCSKIMMRKRDLQRHIEMRHFPQPQQSQDGDQDQQSVRGGFSSDSVSNISSISTCSSSNEEEDEEMEEADIEI